MVRLGAMIWLILWVLLSPSAAGERADDEAMFRRADRPWSWEFPRDHGSHSEFQTEWWYFTGALEDLQDRRYGFELTFFRFALQRREHPSSSVWRARDLILAHFTISEVDGRRFHLSERSQRAAADLAGADTDSLRVWLGDWTAVQAGSDFRIRAGDDHRAELQLRPERAPVLHGEAGLSWKSVDRQNASYYYSIPRMRTEGTLWLDEQPFTVTGTTWMDHEFFTGDTPVQGVGWDWFSCRLDDGRDIMLYLLRYPDGSRFHSGTLVERDGSSRPLSVEAMTLEPLRKWSSPQTNASYPVSWRLFLPRESLELRVDALLDEQEVHAQQTVGFAYWEGLSSYSGSFGEESVTGEGYVELTGYTSPD